MADANVLRLQDDLICSICLETLTDPVSIPCGHNFCMKCISESWNHSSVCRCPQCREAFTPRPSLSRNTLLNEVIEKIKQMGPLPSQSYARPEDVECDACTGKKFRALQSCLTCLASYCEIHLQPHCEGAAFKDHKLIAPDRNLQQKLCSKHHKCLEIFCKKDQMCICLLCVVTDHNTHEMVEVEKEREEKQKQLHSTILEIQTKLQERKKKLEEITQAVEKTEIYADNELEESEKTFTDLILHAEQVLKNVKELITVQRNREVEKAARVREHLEKEIEELKRKNAELAELSKTDDNIHFLQTFPSTSILPGGEDSLRFTVTTDVSFGNLRKGLSCFKEHLEGISKMEIEKVSRSGSEVLAPILQSSTPQSRDKFLQYFCPLTLDPSTAHRELHLSEGDRKARRGPVTRYRDHPDRFDYWPLVLCTEALADSCFYWEVEWSGDWIDIGVTYKGICRKGTSLDCGLGYNDKSWSLFCSDSRFSVRHNKMETGIIAHQSRRIGVYLDHPSGYLSFYSVSDTMTLLYTFKASFTEPLYPGFWVTGSLTICEMISEQQLPRVTS